MGFEAQILKFDQMYTTMYVMVPEEFLSLPKVMEIKRLYCTLNDELTFQCGLIPDGKGNYCIMINAQRIKKLKVRQGDKLKVKLRLDESKYGMEMPEVFQVFLEQDRYFNELFHRLTPGKQRSLLYMVLSTKKEEKQIEKTTVISNHLKKMNGKVDYKILQQDFKEFNHTKRML